PERRGCAPARHARGSRAPRTNTPRHRPIDGTRRGETPQSARARSASRRASRRTDRAVPSATRRGLRREDAARAPRSYASASESPTLPERAALPMRATPTLLGGVAVASRVRDLLRYLSTNDFPEACCPSDVRIRTRYIPGEWIPPNMRLRLPSSLLPEVSWIFL